MVESPNDAVEEAVTQAVGTSPQCPVPPPRQQQLEQVMCWIGPVCNGPPGSGGRPLSEYFLPRRQLLPNSSPSIPDNMVQTVWSWVVLPYQTGSKKHIMLSMTYF